MTAVDSEPSNARRPHLSRDECRGHSEEPVDAVGSPGKCFSGLHLAFWKLLVDVTRPVILWEMTVYGELATPASSFVAATTVFGAWTLKTAPETTL